MDFKPKNMQMKPEVSHFFLSLVLLNKLCKVYQVYLKVLIESVIFPATFWLLGLKCWHTTTGIEVSDSRLGKESMALGTRLRPKLKKEDGL